MDSTMQCLASWSLYFGARASGFVFGVYTVFHKLHGTYAAICYCFVKWRTPLSLSWSHWRFRSEPLYLLLPELISNLNGFPCSRAQTTIG
ncbi:uncharacterized protein BO87DRAFT_130392 [Aspergillus neoniger CBS 115656]|uniref:Uncharacterized protein n=1 Tax=Aspergillus neoniger (strain CBS 115656) TaxID=1448310 RepID=A0A318YXD0_ASPNB|nr:hypothetical protein BO87DRAFT_130392 [Aspergillus neoniger CBS 115656]PYH38627.1 hypothetical protein BO87DRAFT_130392 [Aspergillus neoniger CBS 115656]